MPKRYKTYRRSKRRYFRKKRVVRRRNTRRFRKLSDSTVYRFCRNLSTNVVGPATTGTVSTAFTLQLSQIPTRSDFTSLFEEYKITKIVLEFMPRQGFQYAGNVDHGIFHIWNDYDDSTPGDQDVYNQKQDVKHYNISCNSRSKFTHTLFPRVQTPVYRTGVNFGYIPRKSPWINTENDDVTHYGVKWHWNNVVKPSNDVIPVIHVIIKVYMKFRRPK